jgi:hypothetical protein
MRVVAFSLEAIKDTGVSAMHWADLFLVGLIAGGIYLGSVRGIVQEIGDFLIVLFSSLVGFRLYRAVGGFIKGISVFSSWSPSWLNGTVFFLLAGPTFLAILTGVLHVDRLAKEQERIPSEVRKYGGAFVAIFKSFSVASLFIGLMACSGLMTESETATFRNAGVVKIVKGFSGPTQLLVRLAAPSDIASYFIGQMTK